MRHGFFRHRPVVHRHGREKPRVRHIAFEVCTVAVHLQSHGRLRRIETEIDNFGVRQPQKRFFVIAHPSTLTEARQSEAFFVSGQLPGQCVKNSPHLEVIAFGVLTDIVPIQRQDVFVNFLHRQQIFGFDVTLHSLRHTADEHVLAKSFITSRCSASP